MSKHEEEVRELSLKSEDLSIMQEEAHYHHTINEVIELMIVYGQFKVLLDITKRMQELEI